MHTVSKLDEVGVCSRMPALAEVPRHVAAKAKQPHCKPLLIVLTDGETNTGLSFNKVKPVLAGVKIPIYTIGYNAKLDILRQISAINEAASLNADEGDIAYKIGALLNAEM